MVCSWSVIGKVKECSESSKSVGRAFLNRVRSVFKLRLFSEQSWLVRLGNCSWNSSWKVEIVLGAYLSRSSTVGKLFLEHFVARSLRNCSRGEGSFGVDALFLGGAAYGLIGWGKRTASEI